jgi:hypothetical protein
MSVVTHAHPTGHASHHAAATPATWGVLAEFESPGALMHAAEQVRDQGYVRWDCYTPFPVHGLDRAMGVKMTKMPIMVFFCGLTGAALGVLLQWFTNASDVFFYSPVPVTGYPYMISGKPEWSLPANIPVIFELTILFSAFGAVFGMLGLNRLPTLSNPLFTSKRFLRATTDRFFIAIEAADPRFDEHNTASFLRNTGAAAVETISD